MKVLKSFLISLLFISFAFSVSLKITVEDVPEGVVSGASVSLIGLGSNFSGTTGSDGTVTIENIPDHSIFMIKMSKTNYVNTYWGPYGISSSDVNPDVGAVTESNPIFSQSFYNNNLHASPAPSHISGKADIVGVVSYGDEGVPGVVISAKYLDTGQSILSSQIKYFGNDLKPENYSSTQDIGVFCIYNVDPGRPILITGTKQNCLFTQVITIGYPDSVTLSGIDEVNNYISISGYVKEQDNRLEGASVSILGTSISTTTNLNGEFTLNNIPPKSSLIAKVSKTNYKNVYFIGRSENQNATDVELFTISNTLYNQILPIQHISGKGDILATVEASGVVGKLYNYQGNEVNLSGKIYYWDEAQKKFIQANSTDSSGTFIILNLDPGVYFLRPIHDNIDFPSQFLAVFSDGITYAEFEVNLPKLHVWGGSEIQVLPDSISKNAQNVEMLRFNLWKEENSENIIVTSLTFTAKGTGNISNSVSSVKLYRNPYWSNNPTNWIELGTGTINGNKIIFYNLNLEVWESVGNEKHLSLVFNFNGNANYGETFGVDILSSSDITGYGENSHYPIKVEGTPVNGRLTTIQALPPEKPQVYVPPNGTNPLSYTIGSSQFNPGQGNTTHKASQWRIWKNGESPETLTWDSGEDTIHLTYISTPVLLESYTGYYVQVRHENGDNVWSDWSDAVSFITGEGGITPPQAPTNQSPSNEATDVEIPVTLQASSFVPGSSNTHIASQWIIYKWETNEIVFDSKRDTTNLTSITISSLLPKTKYYWKVRYQDGNGAWSNWSNPTSFTTKQINGDLNGDDSIDISDVILCLRMAIGLDPVNVNLADMNGDGEVDISDVILILRKAIGLD
jgi:hypothetical protein